MSCESATHNLTRSPVHILCAHRRAGLKHGGLLALIGVHDRITVHVKQQAYGLLADSCVALSPSLAPSHLSPSRLFLQLLPPSALTHTHTHMRIHIHSRRYRQASAMADIFGRDTVQQVMRRIERCVGRSRNELQLQLGQVSS